MAGGGGRPSAVLQSWTPGRAAGAAPAPEAVGAVGAGEAAGGAGGAGEAVGEAVGLVELAARCVATPGCRGFSAAGDGEEVSGTPVAPGAGLIPQIPQGGVAPPQLLLLLRDKGAALPRAGALPTMALPTMAKGSRSLMDTRHTAADAEAEAADAAHEAAQAGWRRMPGLLANPSPYPNPNSNPSPNP